MNRIKLFLYIATEVFLLIMARVLFVSTGKIETLTQELSPEIQTDTLINNLYVLQALVIFVPFLIILGLAIYDFVQHQNLRKQQAEKEAASIQSEQKEETEDTARLQQEREEELQRELESKKQKLHQCIDNALKSANTKEPGITSEKILSCLAEVYEITQAEIFVRETTEASDRLILSSTYAFYIPDEKVFEFQLGEGLIGQVAKAAEPLYLDELPQGYITVKSGLGSATPSHLLLVPWTREDNTTFAVLEIASFKSFEKRDIEIIKELSIKLRDFYV